MNNKRKNKIPAGNHKGVTKIEIIFVLLIASLVAIGALYLVNYTNWFEDDEDVKKNYVNKITNIDIQLTGQKTLKKFDSYSQLNEFIEEHALYSDYYGYGSDMVLRDAGLAEEASGFDQSMSASGKETIDYSTTNIQVTGVDEADIVKNDDEYIYAVAGNNVQIVDARSADQARIVSTIGLNSTPQNIYVNGDYLVIFGQEFSLIDKTFYDLIRQNSNYTFFKVFDIKDRANPKQVKDLEFEGVYSNSRMIGDYVYFITTNPTSYVYEEYPIPMVVENEKLLPVDTGRCTNRCPDVYYVDMPYYNYNFTTVAAINIKDSTQDVESQVYLLSGNENVYVSEENMYIAYTKYINENQLQLEVLKDLVMPELDSKNVSKIQDIENSPSHVLSLVEKLTKVGTIVTGYVDTLSTDKQSELGLALEAELQTRYDDIAQELEKTVIHKIKLDKDKLNYRGSGEVTGHVLNQFSMDEYNGYFRIATTKNRNWSNIEQAASDSYNNVYVLDGDLKEVGSVKNLAAGEQIYSARFMQGRVYLVTFRQSDPLYAIDLTEPKNPKVLGELKVPGFSSYLHPYDETTLIGFGKQATDSGQIQGLKVSLFDITDVANMKEIDTYEMGDAGSDSIALNDHKAFLFSKSKNLLVIPVTLSQLLTDESYKYNYTTGAMVFTVTKDGFTFRDRIDHIDEAAESVEDYFYGYSYYDTTVKRSLYIGDVLYTISEKYLKSNSLNDLELIKEIIINSQ